MKNLYLLTPKEIKKVRKLTRLLEKALIELIELKQITSLDENPYPPAESDLIEEQSFLEYQLSFFPSSENQEF